MGDNPRKVNMPVKWVVSLSGVVMLWQVVPQKAEAQGCLGQVHCKPWNDISKTCGSEGYDNTGCGAGTNEPACNWSYDFGKSCGNAACYIIDTCYWDGGGSNPTPTPTDAPTCASCQAWEDELCGPPSCAANQRYQSRNCDNIAGCATTRCVSDSSCSATPTPTTCPTVATPGELTATYNGGASSTFSWNAVSNSSTPVTYGLQIDNYGSGWTSDTCAGTVQGGDTCNLNYTGTSFTRPTNLGNSFRWRVKANNACGKGLS